MKCTDHHQHIGFLIKCIDKTIVNEINKELEKYDITAVQQEILAYLYFSKNQGPVYQKDIEHYLRLSNPTVAGIVKRLESKKMINRFPAKEDGRFKCLVLTEKGEEVVLETLSIGPNKIEGYLTKGLNQEERKELVTLLNKVLKSIK